MYLNNIRIQNIGPIKTLKLDLPFSGEGKPDPLALVGPNGSGKTILLAHIADALYEFAAKEFVDALPLLGMERSLFMLGSGTHVHIGAKGGCCYLKFTAEDFSPQYVYKSGQMAFEECQQTTDALLTGPMGTWDEEGNYKATNWADKKQINKQFKSQAHCFFPSHRFEIPHWQNIEALKTSEKYASMRPRFQSNLDDPIMVENSSLMNQQWLLDVILDRYLYEDQPTIAAIQQNALNQLIQEILGRSDIRFGIGPRTSPNRISIVSDDGHGNITTICPSLDHLSAGQAILFNLFASIIRYADKSGQSIPQQIKGLVLIDEADSNLHIDLQYNVFPKLIGLFPNIQFIFTSHSPLLLLGMKKEFGDDFHIIEMPNGSEISAEYFSEFSDAFDALKQTNAFNQCVEDEIGNITKPVVFVEGKTDVKYLQEAFRVFGQESCLDDFEIKRIGVENGSGGKGDGKGPLNKVAHFLLTHPEVAHQKMLLLFDHDANQKPADNGRVFVRSLEKNEENTLFKNGIENLFPLDLLEQINGMDGYWKEKPNGVRVTIYEPDKNKICGYICGQGNVSDKANNFEKFGEIVEEIIHIILPPERDT